MIETCAITVRQAVATRLRWVSLAGLSIGHGAKHLGFDIDIGILAFDHLAESALVGAEMNDLEQIHPGTSRLIGNSNSGESETDLDPW